MSGALVHAYERYVDDVYGYLAYRHGSRELAEALTRATFEQAFADGSKVARDPRGHRVALLAIARELGPAATADVPAGDELAIPDELAMALSRVDRGECAVLALRFGAGVGGAETAAVLGLSEARVRQLLSRGLRRIRTELEQVGSNADVEASDSP